MATTTVERIAGWASEVAPGDVPPAVAERCRAQRRSVLAAVAASRQNEAARRVLAGVERFAADGPAPLLGTGRSVRVEDAVYAAAALSIALDFDDYACFAHTGHSAVLVPVLVSAETGSGGAEQLCVQAVANEVGARLGGACLLGPLNGQLWSFVHAAMSALAAGRLLGLDALRLAHALALALYQAPRPTMPGFMAPDSKLLTASEPAAAGLRAARLAAAGVTGPLDVLDHPQGFLAAFSYLPLPALLGGLGEGWATRTVTVKPYPGCAYLDTAVDALLEMGPPPSEEVEAVEVAASLLTCEMDALSRPYASGAAPGEPPSPVTVNFSVPSSLAVTLLAGRLTPKETSEEWLGTHRVELARLAARVSVRHDWQLTLRAARSMAPLLPPRAMLRGARARRLPGAVRRVREIHGSSGLRPGDGMALVRALWNERLSARQGPGGPERMWDPDALEAFAMTFPARVRVTLRGGRVLETEVACPRGGAGNPAATPDAVSREKLAACAVPVWGTEGTARIAGAVESDAAGLWSVLGVGDGVGDGVGNSPA